MRTHTTSCTTVPGCKLCHWPRGHGLGGSVGFFVNSNWTFIALNLPYSKGTLRCNKTKTVNQFQYPGTEKSPSTTENARG